MRTWSVSGTAFALCTRSSSLSISTRTSTALRSVLTWIGRATGCDQAALVRVDHRLHAVADAELLEDARDVRLGGRLADHEPLADLGVGQPAGEQVEDLALAWGQVVDRGWRRRSGGGRLPRELLDHRAGDG